MKISNKFIKILLVLFLLFQPIFSNGQINKNILIKSVESYVLINYSDLYELFLKEKAPKYDSIFAEVDSEYFCIGGINKSDYIERTILCMYEGLNNEIHDFVLGDLNNDGKTDAIVTFTLEGFAGGNGYGRFHATIIQNEFNTRITSVNYFYPSIKFESIYKGIIYGKQKGYADEDAHCCPSLIKDVIYQFKKNKLLFVKDFGYKKTED